MRKPDGTSWCLTQDLRAINSLIIPLAPIVPDVPTILNSIPHNHTCFTWWICVQPSSPSLFMQRLSRCFYLHLKVCSLPEQALLKDLLIALMSFPLR